LSGVKMGRVYTGQVVGIALCDSTWQVSLCSAETDFREEL